MPTHQVAFGITEYRAELITRREDLDMWLEDERAFRQLRNSRPNRVDDSLRFTEPRILMSAKGETMVELFVAALPDKKHPIVLGCRANDAVIANFFPDVSDAIQPDTVAYLIVREIHDGYQEIQLVLPEDCDHPASRYDYHDDQTIWDFLGSEL